MSTRTLSARYARTLSARYARTWGCSPTWAALDCIRRLMVQGWDIADAIQYAGEIG